MPVAIVLKRAIQASSQAHNLKSLSKARKGGDRKPLWVWDCVPTQLQGSCGKLQMTRLGNPSPANRIQSTKY